MISSSRLSRTSFLIVVGAMLLACPSSPSPTDAGPVAPDAGSHVCAASPTAGCQTTCELFHDCFVRSSVASFVDQAFAPLGFTGTDFMDCSGCIARCEAGGAGDATALACFAAQAMATSCIDVGDPTQVGNAINACCEGQLDSPFCRDTCFAVLDAQSDITRYVPACRPFWTPSSPPSCAGTCPAVTRASVIPVDITGNWTRGATSYAIADDGSFVVHGRFDGTVAIGSLPMLTATGASSFVAMFDASGAASWATSLPGADQPTLYGRQVALDAGGNIYVVTGFTGAIDLGMGQLRSAGGADVLLASWDRGGALRWAHRYGGTGSDVPRELAVDASGVLLVAHFTETAEFGGAMLTSAGDTDIAVARYALDGTHVWSRSYGGTGPDDGYGIAAHPSGDHSIVGEFSASIDFGTGVLSSAGSRDCFLARFGDDGTPRWSTRHGAEDYDYSYEIAADGDRAVVSDFARSMGTVDYGAASLMGFGQVLASYDADGSLPWVIVRSYAGTAGSMGTAVNYRLDVDSAGRILSAGILRGTVDFGVGSLTDVGHGDIVLASYQRDGTARWAFRMGTAHAEEPPAAHRLSSGELAVVGSSLADLDYGSGVLTSSAPYLYVMHFAAE